MKSLAAVSIVSCAALVSLNSGISQILHHPCVTNEGQVAGIIDRPRLDTDRARSDEGANTSVGNSGLAGIIDRPRLDTDVTHSGKGTVGSNLFA
jgi:hypothetical protein